MANGSPPTPDSRRLIHFGRSTRHAVPLSADAKWIEP